MTYSSTFVILFLVIIINVCALMLCAFHRNGQLILNVIFVVSIHSYRNCKFRLQYDKNAEQFRSLFQAVLPFHIENWQRMKLELLCCFCVTCETMGLWSIYTHLRTMLCSKNHWLSLMQITHWYTEQYGNTCSSIRSIHLLRTLLHCFFVFIFLVWMQCTSFKLYMQPKQKQIHRTDLVSMIFVL